MTEEIGNNAGAVLRGYVERIERLNEEKKALQEDVKGVLNEAKAVGFDKQIIRKVIQIRAMDPQKRSEQEALVATYIEALGG